MTLALRYAVRSDVGLLREGNEDAAYAGPHLLAVADGMGGYEAGEVASAAVISSVAPLDRNQMPETELVDALSAAVNTAKQALRNIVDADPTVGSMGTTLTAMLWSGDTAAICHIGDSRAYLLRDGEFYQITRDHTFVQALIDQGRIRPEEAATHPQRSLLLRALDGRTDADPDISVLTAQAGDRFLLCSDGLPVAVGDEQILEVLAQVTEPSDAVLQLIELAISGGGPDNITCIVADVIDTSESRLIATKSPIVAGAAASVTQNDTKPIPRSTANGDNSVTRMGTIPSGAMDSAPVSTDGGNATNSRSRTAVRHMRTPVSQTAPARVIRPRRRRWPLMTTIIALFVLILSAGAFIGYQDIRSQYYVGFDRGMVVIFRGINQKVLGVSLSSVDRSTGIPKSGLPANDVQGIGHTSFRSLASAQQFVASLRQHYLTCRAAFGRRLAWEANRVGGKVVFVQGKRKVDLIKKPMPTVPAMCLTTSKHPAL